MVSLLVFKIPNSLLNTVHEGAEMVIGSSLLTLDKGRYRVGLGYRRRKW